MVRAVSQHAPVTRRSWATRCINVPMLETRATAGQTLPSGFSSALREISSMEAAEMPGSLKADQQCAESADSHIKR